MPQFTLNRKNFALTRIMPEDVAHKYAYLHVSNKGTVCLNGFQLVRVTLPKSMEETPGNPAIYTPEMIEAVRVNSDKQVAKMPEGLPAKTTGSRAVPVFDNAIPGPEQMGQSIILDGKALIELLKVACDVTDHTRNLVRLSIAKHGGVLRIDAHREEGEQDFTGIQVAVQYKGHNIPGLPAEGEVQSETEMVDAKGLTLTMNEGRKFRE